MNQINQQKPVFTNAHESILKEIHQVAKMMDSFYEIPVIRKSIGIDAVVGLLPGFGDFVAVLPSLYILWRAKSMEIPNEKLIEMTGNIIFDTATGSLPIMGDLFDLFWQANIKNINIIHNHFGLPRYKPNQKQENLFSRPHQSYSEPPQFEQKTFEETQLQLSKSSLTFAQWIEANPAVKYFSLEEQEQGYQNYLNSQNS